MGNFLLYEVYCLKGWPPTSTDEQNSCMCSVRRCWRNGEDHRSDSGRERRGAGDQHRPELLGRQIGQTRRDVAQPMPKRDHLSDHSPEHPVMTRQRRRCP